jgi:hypothetical protein
MFAFTSARRFTLRPSKRIRRANLAIETLEVREVPANNITIVAGATDVNIEVQQQGNSPTVTIRTTGGDAQLSLGTLEGVLSDPDVREVTVTTDAKNPPADDDQAGNIVWNVMTAGSLDFTGFGGGKVLIFETVDGTNAVGDITLTAVEFDNGLGDDQISLVFDTSATNGDIRFQDNGIAAVTYFAESVKDLTINAGQGSFEFSDNGTNISAADAGGAVSITAGDVTISHLGGLTAVGPLSITSSGEVVLEPGTGLYAEGDLTITATGAVAVGPDGLFGPPGLTALGGALTISGSSVSLNNVVVTASDGFSVNGTTSVTLTSGAYDVQGDVSITSVGPVNLDGVAMPALETVGDMTISGLVVNLANSVDIRAKDSITVVGAVSGASDLVLACGGPISFSDDIGSPFALTSFTLLGGNLNLGAHDLNAATVTVGDSTGPVEATLGVGGILTGNVVVEDYGNLAPGGNGTVGTLNVAGNVTFSGGDFAVDFGPAGAADKLVATGNVAINAGSELGNGLGTGQLTAANAIIIQAGGAVTGTFSNAAAGVPVLVGTDVVTANYFSNFVVVEPYTPPGSGTTVSGFDEDGTLFKATLTGGGQLVIGRDSDDLLFLVARNTTGASQLVITTTVNGSDDVVTIPAGVLVSGPLALFKAPKINIGTQFRASGAVAVAVLRDFLNLPDSTGIRFGGSAGQLTSITARNIIGSVATGSTLALLKVAQTLGAQVGNPTLEDSLVTAPAIKSVTARSATTNFKTAGRLGLLKVAGQYTGRVSAASIGKVDVMGADATLEATGAIGSIIGRGETPVTLELSANSVGVIKVESRINGDGLNDGVDWDVTNGIKSITAASIADVDVRAKFVGAVLAKGHSTFGLRGDVSQVNFTLTGNDGTLSEYGMKSLTAKGNVEASRFDIEDGNVGPVIVGRFHFSQIYLNYDPAASGDFTAGAFGQRGRRLASFKTTALPLGDDTHPLNWAFVGSEIAADRIGTVTLSGLQTDNSGTGFGIKVRSPGASVVVKNADVTNDPDLPLNTPLNSDKTAPFTPLVNDFFFIEV